MGVRHLEAPLWGVQFHPESICSEHGARLLRNFRDLALAASTRGRARLRGDEQRLVRRQPIVRFRRLTLPLDAERVFAAAVRRARGRLLARQQYRARPPETAAGRFSFMGDDRGPLAELLTYDVASAPRDDTHGERHRAGGRAAARLPRRPDPRAPHDHLGAAVRLQRRLRRLPRLRAEGGVRRRRGARARTRPTPRFVFADRFLAFDHEAGDVWLVALEAHDAPAAPWLDEMTTRLTALAHGDDGDGTARRGGGAAADPRGRRRTRRARSKPRGPPAARPRHDDDAYLALIERCQEAIRAGETYEVCLTNHVELARRDRPVAGVPAPAQGQPGAVRRLPALPAGQRAERLAGALPARGRRRRGRGEADQGHGAARGDGRGRPRDPRAAARQREGPRREPDDRRPAAQRPRRRLRGRQRARAGAVRRRVVRDRAPARLDDPRADRARRVRARRRARGLPRRLDDGRAEEAHDGARRRAGGRSARRLLGRARLVRARRRGRPVDRDPHDRRDRARARASVPAARSSRCRIRTRSCARCG